MGQHIQENAMKRVILSGGLLALALGLGASSMLTPASADEKKSQDKQEKAAEPKENAAEPKKLARPESSLDRASYGIGLNMGRNFQRNGVEVNLDYFLEGLKHGMSADAVALMDDEEIQDAMRQLQTDIRKRQQEVQATAGKRNKEEGEAYLAKNKQREGVVTLPSGLQYEVLTEGEGEIPAKADRVKVHYTGTLIDGTKFDSSVDRGQPAMFPVTGVIAGWTEALQLMKVGSKWKLHIPSSLAYGQRGSPPRIGPNAVLVFEVELLSIEPK